MHEPIDLNLRHLRAFCEVAARGSISEAAGHVHLSQPAVTKAIAKLERTLGSKLFARASTGMNLTEAGRLMNQRTSRALEKIRSGAIAAQGGPQRRKSGGFAGFDRLVTGPQLRALIAVARARNFSLAARTIGISQPSVHRLARDLERIAGVELYTRTPRGIALTQAAEDLARHARLAFAELQQGLEELAALRGEENSTLNIGTLPLARTALLPRAINTLSGLSPQIRIRVVDGPYDDLLHELRHGGLDLLIGALRAPPPIDDVLQSRLFDDRLSVIGRRGHPLAGRRRLTLRHLGDYPWIAPRSGPPSRTQFDALFAGTTITAREALVEASSLVLIRGMLMESDRLTLLSTHQVEPEIRHGMLEVIPFTVRQTPRSIGYTVRRDWQPTATQAQFLELLRDVCVASYRDVAYSDFE